MTTKMQITQLRRVLVDLLKRKKDLQKWLIEHFDSPDRMKVIGDLNDLDVRINTTKYKLTNVEKNAPILGHEILEVGNSSLNGETNKRNQI